MTTPLPFVDLKAQYARLKPRMDARIRAVLDHGQFILGPEVQELEAELVRFSGAAHAITVSSGTVALTISLIAEGIGPGDAVFMPAFTFAATAEPVLSVGATPVFGDVGADTFNMDPADLERAVADILAGGSLRPRLPITTRSTALASAIRMSFTLPRDMVNEALPTFPSTALSKASRMAAPSSFAVAVSCSSLSVGRGTGVDMPPSKDAAVG